jgi:hypothetical protein
VGNATDTEQPEIEIRAAGRNMGPPPLVDLLFDVTLRNQGDADAWFLVPTSLDTGATEIGGAGVHTIEIYRSGGVDRVLVGRFLGPGGFQAVMVSPAATVTLRAWPISLWDEDSVAAVNVRAVIASGATVGGRPIGAWFPEDHSQRDAEGMWAGSEMLVVEHSPDLVAIPVALEDDRRFEFEVEV